MGKSINDYHKNPLEALKRAHRTKIMANSYIRKLIQLELSKIAEANEPFKKTVYGYKKVKVTKNFSNKDQYLRWKEQNARAKDPSKIYITDQDGNSEDE